MSPHHSGIPKHDLQLHTLEPLQPRQEIPPDPTLNPALPAHINRVPVPVGRWQIPPRCTRAQTVQNALQRLAVAPYRRTRPGPLSSGGSSRLICSKCASVKEYKRSIVEVF